MDSAFERRTLFSACRRYRYALWRVWDVVDKSYVLFIGLNPSTADETHDDPTLRRCIGFAKSWGYPALCMTNLFAWRATLPRVMKACAQPVGEDNDPVLMTLAVRAGIVIAAWGMHGAHQQRAAKVTQLLPRLHCLGLTKDGYPRHPLYVRGAQTPLPLHIQGQQFGAERRRRLARGAGISSSGRKIMKAAFSGVIAVVLLGLYVYAVFMGVNVVNCVSESGCARFTLSSFTDGMANAMSLIGGLVSALVIAELAITQPGDQPVARALTSDPTALSNRFIKYTTLIYLLVWVAVGLWAYIVGVMQHPKVVQPLTDLGQAWLGLAVAAVYAYFGITPK